VALRDAAQMRPQMRPPEGSGPVRGAGGSQSGASPLCLGVSQLTDETVAGRAIAAAQPPGMSLDGLPAAFQLACACCIWPPSAARDAQVRAAAQGVDWARFLRVLGRQRVAGLARDALTAAAVPLPADVDQRLTALGQGGAMRALALAAEAVRLRRLLDVERLPALFIKGAALAELAYGSLGLKSARDVDLLVAPGDAARAFEILKREGYVVTAPASDFRPAQMQLVFEMHKDLELYHPGRGLNVELHWRLIDNHVLLREIGLGSATQEVPVLGGSLRTLGDAELFAYLCVHGASHCWFRLKWLADLNAWLTRCQPEEITGFYRYAEQLGVEACAGPALLLCNRLLGLPLPEALAPALRTRRMRMLVDVALDAMAGSDAEIELSKRPFGPFRTLPAQFFRGRGPAFLFAQCGLLFRNLDDMLTYPLPRALHFLYPLLRLPFWLLRASRRRKTPRAASGPSAGPSSGPTSGPNSGPQGAGA
jgi:hypothetical protein